MHFWARRIERLGPEVALLPLHRRLFGPSMAFGQRRAAERVNDFETRASSILVRWSDALGHLLGLVDPGWAWKGWRRRPSSHEAFRSLGVCLVDDALPLGEHRFGAPIVDVLRGQKAEGRMVMLGVVPAEDRLGDVHGVLLRAEAFGKPGRYFRVLNWASE